MGFSTPTKSLEPNALLSSCIKVFKEITYIVSVLLIWLKNFRSGTVAPFIVMENKLYTVGPIFELITRIKTLDLINLWIRLNPKVVGEPTDQETNQPCQELTTSTSIGLRSSR